MYDLIYNLIDHSYTTGDSSQQYIYYTCCAMILLLSVVFIDALFRVFLHFMRGGR